MKPNDKPQFLITLGDVSNLKNGMFDGDHLHGCADPRIAMVGRSNVGKSSLINAMLGAKMAQVSKEPGKTRAIHFYRWPKIRRVVADLPGYGFAKTGHAERDRWAKFIQAYFDEDQNLARALVLLDSRHGPTEIDIEALRFLVDQKVPVTPVFSKTDQLKTQSERAQRRKIAGRVLQELGLVPEEAFWVSSRSGSGLQELADFLSRD